MANFIANLLINSICIMRIIISRIFPSLIFLNVIPTSLNCYRCINIRVTIISINKIAEL